MSSKFRILQQNDGTTVFPITRAEGIYFKDNTTFDKLSFFPVGAIYISIPIIRGSMGKDRGSISSW